MYISIDIETSGRDPLRHQILEFAAVADTGVPLIDCPYLHVVIPWKEIIGEPFALAMNASLLEKLASRKNLEASLSSIDSLALLVERFLDQFVPATDVLVKPDRPTFHPVGKNYAGFDRQFLDRVPGWKSKWFSHRSLDIGTRFATCEKIPSTVELMQKYPPPADLPGGLHNALFDARYALYLARLSWGSLGANGL